VHQGSDYTTIEIDSSNISDDELSAVEDRANDAIFRDLPVHDFWIDEHEIESYPLRRPPKVGGRIRLVEIEDFDMVACGGVHLRTSGAVGLVKAVGRESIRGNTRVYFKIGRRALLDYRIKTRVVNGLVDRFSVPQEEVSARADALNDQLEAAKYHARGLEDRLAALLTARIKQANAGDAAILQAELSEDSSLFAKVVNALAEDLDGARAAVLLSVGPERLLWGLVAPRDFDFRSQGKPVVDRFEGKGGGKGPVYQGILADRGLDDSDYRARFLSEMADALRETGEGNSE
jgi:alanyl-tRNA synthetase